MDWCREHRTGAFERRLVLSTAREDAPGHVEERPHVASQPHRASLSARGKTGGVLAVHTMGKTGGCLPQMFWSAVVRRTVNDSSRPLACWPTAPRPIPVPPHRLLRSAIRSTACSTVRSTIRSTAPATVCSTVRRTLEREPVRGRHSTGPRHVRTRDAPRLHRPLTADDLFATSSFLMSSVVYMP